MFSDGRPEPSSMTVSWRGPCPYQLSHSDSGGAMAVAVLAFQFFQFRFELHFPTFVPAAWVPPQSFAPCPSNSGNHPTTDGERWSSGCCRSVS
jgi:hypothetical protein